MVQWIRVCLKSLQGSITFGTLTNCDKYDRNQRTHVKNAFSPTASI